MTVRGVRARNGTATAIVLGFSTLTAAGVGLSLSTHWGLWLVGQLVLAVTGIQWFVLLHEAGHNTLFGQRWLNRVWGHVAGFFAFIPFFAWQSVHGLHHRWTGWQDLDPTTQGLVPRPLASYERRVVDTCWRYWIPLFSVLYRTGNFWNVPRLRAMISRPLHRRRITVGIIAQLVAYAVVVVWLGPWTCLKVFGVSTLISLSLTDPILFSQHNHVPQALAEGRDVKPHPPAEQVVFTRSLRFPRWISVGVLLNFDAHELHHKYPHVPGYRLPEIDEEMPDTRHWWTWIRAAKRTPASVIMFQNRSNSGLDL